MSIITPTNFNVQSQIHIDSRLTQADITARNGISTATRYWGMQVHVLDSDGSNNPNTYILTKGYVDTDISNNSNWRALAASVGGTLTERAIQFSNGDSNDFYGSSSIRQLNYSDTGIAIGSISDNFPRLEIDSDTIRQYTPTGTVTFWELGTNGTGGSHLLLRNNNAEAFELEIKNDDTLRMQAGGLPTSQPATAGEVWLDNGVLTIGAGADGAYWKTAGTTNLTASTTINGLGGAMFRMDAGNSMRLSVNSELTRIDMGSGVQGLSLQAESSASLKKIGLGFVAANGITILDSKDDIGLTYVGDYSTAGEAFGGDGARWIPDKGYNDSAYVAIDPIQEIKTAHIQLSRLQIQDLNTSPVEIVALPGAGKYIQIIGGSAYLNHNGTTYAGANSDLYFDAGGGLSWYVSSFVTNGSDLIKNIVAGNVSSVLGLNSNLEVYANNNFTEDGGTIDIYVQYVVIDTN